MKITLVHPGSRELDLLAEIDDTQNRINDLQEQAFKLKLRLRELKEERQQLRVPFGNQKGGSRNNPANSGR